MSKELFKFDKDWINNACIEPSAFNIIEGYRKAGDKLVAEVIESGQNQDFLVYPISFSYRQYIELQLKYIILEAKALFTNEKVEHPNNHDLSKLWIEAEIMIKRVDEEIDINGRLRDKVLEYITEDEIKYIEWVIEEYMKVDPGSFSFRYPTNKKGEQVLIDLVHINLRELRDRIFDLSEIFKKFNLVLECIADWEYEKNSFDAEMNAEMKNEY